MHLAAPKAMHEATLRQTITTPRAKLSSLHKKTGPHPSALSHFTLSVTL